MKQSVAMNIEEHPSQDILVREKDSRNVRLMLLRQFIIVPLGFCKSLIILPFLNPNQVFLLKLIQTWFQYTQRTTLGTFAAMGFYYPQAQALGHSKECRRYQNLAWKFNVLGMIVGMCVGGGLALGFFNWKYAWILMIWGACSVPINYIHASFQARGQFANYATVDIVQSIGGLIFPLLGVFFGGFYGLLAGSMISFFLTCSYGKRWFFPNPIHLDKSFVFKTVRDGIQLWAAGFLQTIANTFEITLMAFMLPKDDFFAGYYAVAMTLASVVNQSLTSIYNVFSRRLTITSSQYFEKQNEENSVFDNLADFVIVDVIVFSFSSAIVITGLQLFKIVLPEYSGSISIVPQLLLSLVLFRSRAYPYVLYKVKRTFGKMYIVNIVHIVIGVLMGFLFISLNKSHLLAYCQIVSALFGSTLAWGFIWRIIGIPVRKDFCCRYLIILTMLIVWLAYFIYGNDIVKDIVIAWAGMLVIVFTCYIFFRNSFKILIEILKMKNDSETKYSNLL